MTNAHVIIPVASVGAAMALLSACAGPAEPRGPGAYALDTSEGDPGASDDDESASDDGADSDDEAPTLEISGRPNFLLPFPCGAQVATVTYVGHNPDDKKMDMRRVGMPTGSPITASAAGYVHEQFSPGGIEIRHGNGWFTTYMHMKWHVAPGTWVEQGDVVGEMGNVASPDYHLHYEQLYAPGKNNANTWHMVHPVLQGEGPMVLVPDTPFVRTSMNCGPGGVAPYGAIGSKWIALGGNDSVVGKPIHPENDALLGGRFQDFERGMIIWHPERAPGAFAVHGRIFAVYRETGSEGAWGFPTMDELAAAAAPDGTVGRYQYFESALFLWSDATDAQPIHGAIHDAFVAEGREKVLGYPLGPETSDGDDGFVQEFQEATIHWTPADGAVLE